MSMARHGIAEGSVTVRPWRVALLTDVSSAEDVRTTLRELSAVWGGYYFPILDRNASREELDRWCAAYDVDSLYLEDAKEDMEQFIARPGYQWPGRGPWGPFRSDGGLRKGVLPTATLLRSLPADTYVLPVWESGDCNDLLHAANWGYSDVLPPSPAATIPFPIRRSDLDLLPVRAESVTRTGAAQASRMRVRATGHDASQWDGVHVLDPQDPAQIVQYWNMRAAGARVFALPRQRCESLWRFLSPNMHEFATVVGTSTENLKTVADSRLAVWGLDRADDEVAAKIRQWCQDADATLQELPLSETFELTTMHSIDTNIRRTFRSSFDRGSRGVRVPVPILPWQEDDADEPWPGTVAAVVTTYSEKGQDPRLTANLPPFRRHSALIQPYAAGPDVEHARVCHDGIAFLVQPTVEEITLPFVSNLEVLRLLFDEPQITVNQSDDGRFQSRTAEMLGGAFSGTLTQPGVREVLRKAASKPSGLALQEIIGILRNNLGEWPDPIYSHRIDTRGYVDIQASMLLKSGLLVPKLEVKCTSCNVVSQVQPKELDAIIQCHYCRDEFPLALALKLRKPDWRYTLAGHLPTTKVEAMLPVLATLSVLGQLEYGANQTLCHALGAELKLDGLKQVEMDIAAIHHGSVPTVFLGEVKTSNRIDENDVANIELLQHKLHSIGVRCMPLFATLKEDFTDFEAGVLRGNCERMVSSRSRHGEVLPALPLLLTAPDLSLPYGHRQHPAQWIEGRPELGIDGVALESCKRNLGLIDFQFRGTRDEPEFALQWS
jgi:hypothetical protein